MPKIPSGMHPKVHEVLAEVELANTIVWARDAIHGSRASKEARRLRQEREVANALRIQAIYAEAESIRKMNAEIKALADELRVNGLLPNISVQKHQSNYHQFPKDERRTANKTHDPNKKGRGR